jgi:hypothetical protein
MGINAEKPTLKWLVKFQFENEYTNFLVDLKDTPLFDKKYPVFKEILADEILNNAASHYFHLKRKDHSTIIRDPTGKDVPLGSCLFIFGISKDLGIFKALFFPQEEQRLVLVGLDEVWIKVLENIEPSERMTVITNVAVSLTKSDVWSQVYLLY